MKNITKDKIRATIIGIILIILFIAFIALINFAVKKTFGILLERNEKTGTKYVDKGNYTKVVYADDTEILIGNGKTEYENGEIC